VGSSDQMSEPDEDAPNQKVKFCGHERGLFSTLWRSELIYERNMK
jgi:hypothetical protein